MSKSCEFRVQLGFEGRPGFSHLFIEYLIRPVEIIVIVIVTPIVSVFLIDRPFFDANDSAGCMQGVDQASYVIW